MKLALGTVQFGLEYGAFNRTGLVTSSSVKQILSVAKASGITTLDTAHAYGVSENVLGEIGAGADFRVVTKIPALRPGEGVEYLEQCFHQSLVRLKLDKVYGLLLHRPEDLLERRGDAVWRAMQRLQQAGKVGKIGFSGYGVESAQLLLKRYPIELVQLPLNIFDRRHINSGILESCRSRGIEVHTRSAFLQGFVLADPGGLSGHLNAWRYLLEKFQRRCTEAQISPIVAALQFALNQSQVDQVVIGVDSIQQLMQILDSSKQRYMLDVSEWNELNCDDLSLIDPSRWKTDGA